MLALAALFLFETWFWSLCVALGRRIVGLLPWRDFKAAVKRGVGVLPAPAALLVFLIPVAIVEPIKVVCLGLIAHGHWFYGVLGFIALKFVGLGLIAFVFDLTREKLMTMPWFVVVYGKVMAAHDWAHHLVEPFKAVVIARAKEWRAWARGMFGGAPAGP